jgi:hypothetical protein
MSAIEGEGENAEVRVRSQPLTHKPRPTSQLVNPNSRACKFRMLIWSDDNTGT